VFVALIVALVVAWWFRSDGVVGSWVGPDPVPDREGKEAKIRKRKSEEGNVESLATGG
jgi:hypothetical protein